jgi:hypothetical protein
MQYISDSPVYQEAHYASAETERLAPTIANMPVKATERPFAAQFARLAPIVPAALALVVSLAAILFALAHIGGATQGEAAAWALVVGAGIALAFHFA